MRLLLLLHYKFQLDISDSCTLSRTLSIFLPLHFSLAAQRNCDFSRMLFILLLLLLLLLLRYISHLGRQTDTHIHTHTYMHAIDSLSLSLPPYLSLSILSTLSVIRIMEQQKKLRCLFFVLLLNFIIEILSPPSHQPTTMTLLFPSSI